ncbi:putative DNA-binding protein SNT1 [Ceratocystis platani]|uniref:Putative DNA-binding protein SNT1 n=1 Tax=Ceratocystis fimbriata f. sp. platani TaxID=88771 RepID=A0A0F8B8L7_CERFI|nr:putative DNA-binding protein SNT1 [Ceratocystis platani]
MGMKTPPLDSLPDFNVTVPWFEDELVLDSLKEDPNSTKYVFQHLSKQEAGVCSSMQDASLEFRDRLINYFDFTRSEDPAAIRSRGKFSINGGLDDSEPSSSGSSRKPEGRTRRFASERDLQRILAASIKEDEERKERAEQLKKDQCRNDEKEAVVPDMIWGHERRENMRFLDNSGFIPVRDTVAIWQCLPPIPNFTDMESDLFVKAYLERPKQWGMIAEAIPKRDFRSCIQYYYIKKRELDLKTKLKKQPRRRRKAVKKAKTAPLQDDAENDENQDTNENGERRRPRRAAAPTFGEQAKQAAEEKARAEGAVASEKTDVRRKRKTAKEREKEKEQQREAKAASKAGTSTPQPQVQPDQTEAQTSAPSSSTANERRQGNQPSSYWSVPEMEAFPGLLAHFGTDWSAMATFMTSKTPTMVKNMYARDKDKSGRKTHWEAIARKADEQRANGITKGDSADPARSSFGAGASSSPSFDPSPGFATSSRPHATLAGLAAAFGYKAYA